MDKSSYEQAPDFSKLMGYAGIEYPDLLRESFDIFGDAVKEMPIYADIPDRYMIWETTRKYLGKDIPNTPQLVGDCVGKSSADCVDYLQVLQLGEVGRTDWHKTHPSFAWANGRVMPDIGNGQLGRQDGSLGIWQALAVKKYGIIFEDDPEVPKYTAALARDWGYRGAPKKFMELGAKRLVKVDTADSAMVKTLDQLYSALSANMPVTVASNVGFDMSPRSDGYNHYSTKWPHQMSFIGYCKVGKKPCICLHNNWGESAHGLITDSETGEQWPKGTLRISLKDAQTMLNAQDSWAHSFVEIGIKDGKPLKRELFDIFG